MKFLLISLVKTGLYTHQQLRLITGSLWTMYLVDSEHSIIKAAVEEGKQYHQATVGKSDRGKGPPNPHIFMETLDEAAKEVEKEHDLQVVRAAMVDFDLKKVCRSCYIAR